MLNTSSIAHAFIVVLSSLALSGCAAPRGEITQYGAMRAVMREGQVEPRVVLCDVVSKSNRYAIGALSGLAGEITIDDGAVWVTRNDAGNPVTTGPECVAGDQATLLSVGTIDSLQSTTIDKQLGGDELEAAIRGASDRAGNQGTAPFMFVIDGTASSLDAHVIDGTCLHADPSAKGLKFAIANPTEVRIVGLYADGQGGVLTHHGSSVHMHVILTNNGKKMTAHIDSVTLNAGARLGVQRR